MRMVYPFVWAILLVVCSFVLAHTNTDNYLRAKIEYLHDPSSSLMITDVVHKEFADLNGRALAPVSPTVWLKIKVPKQVESWPNAVLYTGSNEAVISIQAFFEDGNQIFDLGFCDVRLDSEGCRESTLQPSFALPPSLGDNHTLFIKIVPGAGGISNEFYFMGRPYFNKVTIFLANFAGLASGIFIFVSLLAFVLFRSFRERGFLVYSLFNLVLLLSLTVNRGVWDAYKPDAINLGGSTLIIPLLTLVLFFDLFFLKTFFNMRENNRRLNKIYVISLGVLLATTLIGLVPQFEYAAWSLFKPFFFATMILAALTLIYFNYQRRTGAFVLSIAWGLAIACNLIWSLYRLNYIDGFWFFGYYGLVGRVMSAFVLLLALLYKFRALNIQVGYAKAKEEQGRIVKTLLRTLSHDLSNKTQIVNLSAERIERDPSPEVVSRHIGRIVTAADDLRKIIENAKRNYTLRGEQILNLFPVDLAESVRYVVQNYEQDLRSKQIQVHFDFPEGSVMIQAEEVSLCHQVLSNLLINSIKFSHPGGLISFSISNTNDNEIELKVTDNGIGIPASILEKLFDENESVRREGTNGELGTGNGLLIVRDFMSAYGATLKFESRVDRGTTAILRFNRSNEIPRKA